MKIRRFALKNVTSYRERTTFDFDPSLNILIGPNGGGKSNLQKTLALVLSKYFIHQYDFKRDDNEAKIEAVDLWTRRVLERTLPRFIDDDSAQEIELTLAPEAADIDNIRAIGTHLNAFNAELEYYESPIRDYPPLALVDRIAGSTEFRYVIRDFDLEEPAEGTPEWGFLHYLRTFFIFMRLSRKLSDVRLSAPVFFFFSERTSRGRIDVQSNQITESNYFSGYRSAYQAATGENTNLLQWGAQHFARIYRQAETHAARRLDTVVGDLFRKHPDVVLLDHYLGQLGYEWGFLTDSDNVAYSFGLRKQGTEPYLTQDKFSSGEREIVHFLLAMFALNIRDGVVIVDEPELHLHPRWQRIFLGLFRDIAPSRCNQFLIATHSPVFVTPDTINSIIRIFYNSTTGSSHVALRDVELPAKKSLVRMINSQNNERVFFADKAVLVEGITDRLIFSSLLDASAVMFANNEAIEIIEVGGKGNIEDYRRLLDALKTPSFAIADLDYLQEVGAPAISSLFSASDSKAWEALRDKKGLDHRTAVGALRSAIESGSTSELSAFLEYLSSRRRALRAPLAAAEQALLDAELVRLEEMRIFVLRDGAIEQYVPPEIVDVRGMVELTTDRNWVARVPSANRRAELAGIITAILGVEGPARQEFVESMRQGTTKFPAPLAADWSA